MPRTLAITFSMLCSLTSVVSSAVTLTGWLLKTPASAEYAFQKYVVHNPCKELILEADCQLVNSTSA